MEKMRRQYIVITPCRNEEKNLPNLIQSMISQSIKPSLWVIVDDGSIDKTAEIIAEACKKYSWIKWIHLEECEEYMGFHIAHVYNKGFEFAIQCSKKKNLTYQYIAVVDADNIPEHRYFEKLIRKFEDDSKLGIASGVGIPLDIEKRLNNLKTKKGTVSVMDYEFWRIDEPSSQIDDFGADLPIGSARLWQKKCFEATKGYANVNAPDSVSNIKANMRGWKTKRFEDIKVLEREGQTAQGFWKGYADQGESAYFLFYPLSLATLKAIKYLFKRPYYVGIAYLFGYTKSFIFGKKRIDDFEIEQYYRFVKPKEIKTNYEKKMKKLLKI